jgi:hypothetical protein
MLTGDLTGIIDPTQIVSTLIALLPVDIIVLAVVLSINKKVRLMWTWYAVFPMLDAKQIRFAKWWMEHSLATEIQNWIDDHPGETPPWEQVT